MRTAKLEWMGHDLTLPASSPLRSLSPGTAAAWGGVAKVGGGGVPGGHVTIELPDFSSWPTAADKIKLLLEKAAEIEHALMIQYLYSTYSLKSPSSVTDPLQAADLGDWQPLVAEIAREEMGHLMTVQNIRLLVGLEASFVRDDFPMVAGLFPFETSLHSFDQATVAAYVVAESSVDALGIDDIIAQATGSAGMPINRVGILYALIGVVLASSLEEIEKDAVGGDFWASMVRQIAYLAYEQHPPSKQWHLPDAAFHAESAPRQGVQDDWAPSNLAVRIHTLKTRQDAKDAIRDIGLQGEGFGNSTAMPSHFERFLSIYRGHDAIRPFPRAGGWVPTLDVPTHPKIADDPADPGAISNPGTKPWANLADLRYAILLGFLEEYLAKDPVADRAFLATTSLHEMKVNLRRLSAKLVTLPRAATGAGVAALPFGLPGSGFPLPTDPAVRKAIHAARLDAALALEAQILKDQGGAFDPLISPMMAADTATLAHFRPPLAPGGTTMTTPPTPTTTHWPQVKAILDGLIADWTTQNGSPPDLTGPMTHQDRTFGWATKDQLANSKPRGFQLIEPGKAGKDTNLILALTVGVGGFAQMPDGGPYLTDPNPKYAGQLDYIIKWIDEGMLD